MIEFAIGLVQISLLPLAALLIINFMMWAIRR